MRCSSLIRLLTLTASAVGLTVSPALAQFTPAVQPWSDAGASRLLRLKSNTKGARPLPASMPQPQPAAAPKDERARHLLPLAMPKLSAQVKLIGEGDSARDAHDYQRALQIYRFAQRLNPKDAQPILKEAEILFRQGKNVQAETRAQAALRLNPADTDVHLLLAESMLAQGKSDQALRVLEQATAMGSLQKRVYRLLADLYAQSGSTEKSDSEFMRVLEIDSSDVHAATNLADHCRLQSREGLEQAIKLCKRTVPEFESAQLQLQLGLLYLQKCEYGEAVEAFKRARDADPHDPLAFELLAVVSGIRQDWPSAQDYAQSFVDLDPGNVNPLSLLAWATFASGDLQEARSRYQDALHLVPGSPLLHQLYSLVLTDSRRYKDARSELALAHPSGDRNEETALTVANAMNDVILLICDGDFQSARQRASALLKKIPNAAPVNALTAYTCLLSGDYSSAQEFASKAVKLDDSDCLGHLTLARLASDQGNYAQALRELEASGPSWKATSLVLTAKARILYESGDAVAAQNAAQLALQIAPSSLPAKEVLALSLAKQNNWDGAILFLKELVGRNPKDLSLRLALGDALHHRGDLDLAEAAYENARKIAPQSPRPLVCLARLALLQHKRAEARRLAHQAISIDPAALQGDEDLNGLAGIRNRTHRVGGKMQISP